MRCLLRCLFALIRCFSVITNTPSQWLSCTSYNSRSALDTSCAYQMVRTQNARFLFCHRKVFSIEMVFKINLFLKRSITYIFIYYSSYLFFWHLFLLKTYWECYIYIYKSRKNVHDNKNICFWIILITRRFE